MALFKVLRGDESNLPATLNDGWAYFCSDTGNFYIDWADDAGNLARTQVNANYAGKLRYEDNSSFLEIDPHEIALKDDLIQVDPSLTVEGAAADAKAVSNAIAAIPQDDWSQNDSTAADFIKNKPFGEEKTDTLTWDGNPTDVSGWASKSLGLMAYLVSEETPTTDDLTGGSIVLKTPDGVQNMENIETQVKEYSGYIIIAGAIVIVYESVLTFSKPGIYFITSTDPEFDTGYAESMTLPNYEFTTVKTLDETFIPNTIARTSDIPEVPVTSVNGMTGDVVVEQVQADWNQNDSTAPDYVKNRLFYASDPIITEVLHKATLDFSVQTFGGVTAGLHFFDTEITLKAGCLYKVNWNGIVYEVYSFESNGQVLLGDISTVDASFASTGEPFAILNEGMYAWDCVVGETSTQRTISITGYETTITQLPAAYIDDSIKRLVTHRAGTGFAAEVFNGGTAESASGQCSHSEGFVTTASGENSHAEGHATDAIGSASHAEGYLTIASGKYSHAEGNGNGMSGSSITYAGASGECSHTEGYITTAYGYGSHAEGGYTIANGSCQHVQGKLNIKDEEDKYLHIVGNGHIDGIVASDSSMVRSNAHTLDWNGIGWYQGGLQVGGNAQDDGAKSVLLEGDAIPVPSTAFVGQTIVVKAVDDTGKPTEWEAVDMPESVSIDPTLTIEGAAADAKAVGEALQDVSANYVKSSEKAAANGVATLDASGKLQESQKPSYSASEVGLGNVPNVATNDQTPTYTEASTLATLTSGEKLSVAFGKIKKAITDLISHIANTSNPHAVTAEQAGAAPTSHASTATTYGKATSSNYGHVKLSASTSSTSGASSGVAATPSAVKSAYDLANGKQDKISVSGVTGQTKAITCGSTVTLASLAIEAGTYLVFGNAKFPSASSTSGKYVIQCCLSKSTTYNHNASMAIPNNSAAASTLNPHGVFTLSSAGTIYLLGYHGGDSTMTVENINLYAVKIG